jgi:hypothetical protein
MGLQYYITILKWYLELKKHNIHRIFAVIKS